MPAPLAERASTVLPENAESGEPPAGAANKAKARVEPHQIEWIRLQRPLNSGVRFSRKALIAST
jgi:hypothetical protein